MVLIYKKLADFEIAQMIQPNSLWGELGKAFYNLGVEAWEDDEGEFVVVFEDDSKQEEVQRLLQQVGDPTKYSFLRME